MSQSRNATCEAAILIVEDQAPMRDAIRHCIERSFPKLCVVEAPDGVAAVEHVKAYSPALVLMDINLPDAYVLDLTRDIKKLCPPTVVAAISIDPSTHIPAQVLAAGAAAFISKDRLFDELGTLIGAVMMLRNWMNASAFELSNHNRPIPKFGTGDRRGATSRLRGKGAGSS